MQLKSSTICMCLLMMATTGTDAWIAEAKYQNPAYPGKCFINPKMILSPGEKVKVPNQCAYISCKDAEGWATRTGCSAVVAEPPRCKWNGYMNENVPFPMCCVEKVKCRNPNDLPLALELQDDMKKMLSAWKIVQ